MLDWDLCMVCILIEPGKVIICYGIMRKAYKKGVKMSREEQNNTDDQGNPLSQPVITHLMRREIQAPLAACLIRGFAGVLGHERAIEAATAVIQADAMAAGKIMAEKYSGNSLRVLGRVIREVWSEDDAIVVHLLEESDRKLSFNVTRCRYAELYDRVGLKEFGFCLSCSRDEPFAQGLNPNIRLRRTQTIMQGAEYCDFRFILEE
jgi:hypothetical protein